MMLVLLLQVSVIHGWESGLDASPAYDAAYGITDPQPTFDSLYPKFDELIYAYKLRYRVMLSSQTTTPPLIVIAF